ncbi:MAG: phosphotransacetylase family protein [Archaeoglobaceae archaeon]
MKKLLISSTQTYSGKSAIALSLLLILKEKGYDVGYFKPFGVNAVRFGDKICDEDAYFVEQDLGIRSLCAVILDRPYIDFAVSQDPIKLKKKIIDTFTELESKEVVIIEGAQNFIAGASLEICDVQISKMLDSRVLLVSKFTNDFVIDEIINAKRLFDEKLHGVILNQVVGYKKSYIKGLAESVFKKFDLEVLGIIPADPSLMSLRVEEIAKAIDGRFLVKPEKEIEVEQVLVGAMRSESAISHLRYAQNFALIVGGDRSDLITLAIESGAKCIIATGNLEPSKFVLSLAESNGVAVILSEADTATTLLKIQEKFGKIRVRGEKIQRVRELIKENVNLEKLFAGIWL